MRLQSSLGRIHYLPQRGDMDMGGYLTIAKVLKVHQKTGTADIQLLSTKDTFVSSEANEGFYAAKIIQSMAGHDTERGKSWGTVTPISEGSYVLVTFLDRMKNRPIIIGQVADMNNEKNVNTPYYPLQENVEGFDKQEGLKALTVYPSQAFFKIDGESNVEFSHASKSFFAMFSDDKHATFVKEDARQAFDHGDLSEDIEADEENAKQPTNVIFVHRSSFDDEQTTWTKFFIDESGMLRITRDNNDDGLTYLSISPEGALKLRRQVDSFDHEDGENFSEITLETDGSINLNRTVGEKTASITLTKTGEASIEHSSGSHLVVDDNVYLETSENGEILSDSLTKYIEKNHIVVSDEEPKNPHPYLLWIDTSV